MESYCTGQNLWSQQPNWDPNGYSTAFFLTGEISQVSNMEKGPATSPAYIQKESTIHFPRILGFWIRTSQVVDVRGQQLVNCCSSLLCMIAHMRWSFHILSSSYDEAWHLVAISPSTYNFSSLTLHQSYAFMSSPLSYTHKVWVATFSYFLKELGVVVEVHF
jgi:hypothetical protein